MRPRGRRTGSRQPVRASTDLSIAYCERPLEGHQTMSVPQQRAKARPGSIGDVRVGRHSPNVSSGYVSSPTRWALASKLVGLGLDACKLRDFEVARRRHREALAVAPRGRPAWLDAQLAQLGAQSAARRTRPVLERRLNAGLSGRARSSWDDVANGYPASLVNRDSKKLAFWRCTAKDHPLWRAPIVAAVQGRAGCPVCRTTVSEPTATLTKKVPRRSSGRSIRTVSGGLPASAADEGVVED